MTKSTYPLKKSKNRNFLLPSATMFRNEAAYFHEWIIFHHAVIVEYFYLYNNGSTDNFREVLEPWIRSGLVTLRDLHKEGGQAGAFNDCIRRRRMESGWIAFLDVDEFLHSPKVKDLREVLPRYEGYPAIFVYWILFGSSGQLKRSDGSVIENFTRCLDLDTAKSDNFDHGDALRRPDTYVTGWAKDGKSIANPRLVRKYYVHQPEQVWDGIVIDEKFRPPLRRKPGTVDLSCSVFRINHYWSKSIEDIRIKVMKGNACWDNKPNARLERWLDREKYLNRSHDDSLVRLWRGIGKHDAHGVPR